MCHQDEPHTSSPDRTIPGRILRDIRQKIPVTCTEVTISTLQAEIQSKTGLQVNASSSVTLLGTFFAAQVHVGLGLECGSRDNPSHANARLPGGLRACEQEALLWRHPMRDASFKVHVSWIRRLIGRTCRWPELQPMS